MKKILIFILIVLPVYLIVSLYFIDKDYFLCPIEYNKDIIIRSDSRGDGFFAAKRNGNRSHNGIDFLAEVGAPVLAVRSGRVVSATKNKGMGNYIIIRHPQGMITIYGHLSRLCVFKNDFVRQGDVIGEVGKTGNANYRDILPHLHFEVRQNGQPQDPMEYLQ